MKSLFLVLTLFCIVSVSFAQSNFKPGYIITLSSDTVRGQLDYQEWNSNPKSFQFKKDGAVSAERLTPASVRYVNINGLESYERYSGMISTDNTQPDRIAKARDTSFRIDTVFLKVLQTGRNVNLYAYTDPIKMRYFIRDNNSSDIQPSELIHRMYFDSNNALRIVNENTYMRQLFELAAKYNVKGEAKAGEIASAEYQEQPLLKIVSAFNHISTDDYQRKYTEKAKFFPFAGIGVNTAFIKLYSRHVHLQPTSTSTMPLLTGGVDLPVNPRTRRLIFRLELALTENKFKAAFDDAVSPYLPLQYSFTQLSTSLIPRSYTIFTIQRILNFMSVPAPSLQI